MALALGRGNATAIADIINRIAFGGPTTKTIGSGNVSAPAAGIAPSYDSVDLGVTLDLQDTRGAHMVNADSLSQSTNRADVLWIGNIELYVATVGAAEIPKAPAEAD